jgi:hypothetical protein
MQISRKYGLAGLLVIKRIDKLSDERVVEAWVRNPYYQAFTGAVLTETRNVDTAVSERNE